MLDARNYLREETTLSAIPSVMNVSEVKLNESYNFYHDSIPQESRLVYDPLMKLLIKIKKILDDYESPILNDALFLVNYMLTTQNPKTTPLMKILTGLELILNKLEEWEVYASKSLNSCDAEMTLLKQLIIRYRKI
jgi:midasin